MSSDVTPRVARDITAPSGPVLAVEDLSVGYQAGRGTKTAVEHISFELEPGQVLALVGESGSGKSTIGHAILGLLPTNGRLLGGSVRYRGRTISDLSGGRLRGLRGRAISLIPQDPTVSLDPVRRVGPQVEDVLRLHTSLDTEARRQRVHELFELVGFDDVERRYRQFPHELSGGMRQRVLIAAAVAVEPDVIVADEPTSGLDATVQAQVLDLIDDLRRRGGTSVVLITHDLGVAADRSDLVGVLRDGRLAELAPTAAFVQNPQDEYSRHLLDNVPARLSFVTDRSGGTPSGDPEPAVEVRNLSKRYEGHTAVDDISFTVGRGRTFSIVGESGSGKSTTARVLTGLTQATAGRVSLLGTEVGTLNTKAFRPLRRDVQIVFQNPYASFDPRFDVLSVVEEPLRSFQPAGSARRRRQENRDRVVAALEAASLPASFLHRHPRELSGGQRQRVAIARALVLEPKVVVLDEPISALDVSVQAQILELLVKLQSELGLTYVFISHDLAVVRAISVRVAVMRRGRIVEQGEIAQVFESPASPYTAQLLGAMAGRQLAGR
ncbi:dipeptide ABC transporter ATP-binding protein [Streptomyces iranensis]|uniref:ABC peptide transporter, ATP-binding component n=1 Tax=Streptomyces iranensis TaxID=576784 RepID=A0A060ZKP8_9ACTN|nr:ABC transporter ATP-binding protein [Streptomyces iranensis]MBP2063179.1 peptide/nickel transport system ATP-binding protein [Streptomyces iranensis]CDR02130.1 ABC peptide transporter, ATP-binding component [Streptomyces iranensis]